MTEDIEVLKDFEIAEIPSVSYETNYTKIVKAAILLKNDAALKIPLSFFKTKNYKPSLYSSGKRIGKKIKSCQKDGIVYVWEVRN